MNDLLRTAWAHDVDDPIYKLVLVWLVAHADDSGEVLVDFDLISLDVELSPNRVELTLKTLVGLRLIKPNSPRSYQVTLEAEGVDA